MRWPVWLALISGMAFFTNVAVMWSVEHRARLFVETQSSTVPLPRGFANYADEVTGKVVRLPPMRTRVMEQEQHILKVFDRYTRDCHKGKLVVDVGAGDGVYTMLAAARGCRVVAFELQRGCLKKLRKGLTLNGVESKVKVVQEIVSDLQGGELVLLDTGECSADFSINKMRVDVEKKKKEKKETLWPHALATLNHKELVLSTTTLDLALADETEVAFVKLDVEGFEGAAMAGAQALITQRLIAAIVLDSSGMGDRGRDPCPSLDVRRSGRDPCAAMQCLVPSLVAGYKITCLRGGTHERSDWRFKGREWLDEASWIGSCSELVVNSKFLCVELLIERVG